MEEPMEGVFVVRRLDLERLLAAVGLGDAVDEDPHQAGLGRCTGVDLALDDSQRGRESSRRTSATNCSASSRLVNVSIASPSGCGLDEASSTIRNTRTRLSLRLGGALARPARGLGVRNTKGPEGPLVVQPQPERRRPCTGLVQPA